MEAKTPSTFVFFFTSRRVPAENLYIIIDTPHSRHHAGGRSPSRVDDEHLCVLTRKNDRKAYRIVQYHTQNERAPSILCEDVSIGGSALCDGVHRCVNAAGFRKRVGGVITIASVDHQERESLR